MSHLAGASENGCVANLPHTSGAQRLQDLVGPSFVPIACPRPEFGSTARATARVIEDHDRIPFLWHGPG
jgi:hypothetical protein